MTDALLVFNAGSSSLRGAIYARDTLDVLARVHVDAIGSEHQNAAWSGPLATHFRRASITTGSHAGAIAAILDAVASGEPSLKITGAGHRVVHGGRRFAAPARIDADVMAEIGRLTPLAPNHQPHNLAAIRAVASAWPQLAQVACFDTAFHRTQAPLEQRFALPCSLHDAGIQRYGFHGLSYDYLAGELAKVAGARADGRVILAHLGHGASLCALRERRSVATTMGFSALDGLMMGTRCGAIDPGVLLYLLDSARLDLATLSDVLYNRSGLLGVSGLSDDLRVLEASDDTPAVDAIEMFADAVARHACALACALGGLDSFVFSAGIGEHSAAMRARIVDKLGWLGAVLDAQANTERRAQISAADSPIGIYVIPTDEELVIARGTRACLDQIATS
ncbi:MAG TPA: acetate/propionate family kinase [Rudaea sp.]